MTILKKINALSIALIAATIIGAGLDVGFKWYDFGRGFIDGFQEGYEEVRNDTAAQARTDCQNETTADASFQEESQVVKTNPTFLGFLQAVGGIALFITIIVAFLRLAINYIGVLATVRRGDVFSEVLEWRTNRIGIGLIVIYVAEWLFVFIASLDANESPSFGVLCCGIGLMIVAQIFALGRKMKEDQEYMV